MKPLREYIKKEIKRLGEANVKVPLPGDAKHSLFNILNLKPNHINGIKALKSIIPTYRIYLSNDQSFTLSDIGNNFGFGKIEIKGKEYDILDIRTLPTALRALNDLQTTPIIKTTGDEEGGDTGGDEVEEPAEEPVEEPEA